MIILNKGMEFEAEIKRFMYTQKDCKLNKRIIMK